MDSILSSVKKMLGISEDDDYFDIDIIPQINTVFMILNQLGVGPTTCFSIKDKTSVWNDFLSGNTSIEAVKTYVYQKVKLVFDPPTTSALYDALKRNTDELEWRLNVAVDPAESESSNV